jgi:hypothetical protein
MAGRLETQIETEGNWRGKKEMGRKYNWLLKK